MFILDFPTDKLSQITAKHESVNDGTKFAESWFLRPVETAFD